jgi:hypothetical protein
MAPCPLCKSAKAMKLFDNACLTLAERQNAQVPPCEEETLVAEEAESAVLVNTTGDRTEFILTNNGAGVITENCDGPDRAVSLPNAARISLSKRCKQYKFMNTPKIRDLVTAFDIIEISAHQLTTIKNLLKDHVNVIREHFQEFGYIYLLSTMGAIVAAITLICTGKGIQTCQRRYRNRLDKDSQEFCENPRSRKMIKLYVERPDDEEEGLSPSAPPSRSRNYPLLPIPDRMPHFN